MRNAITALCMAAAALLLFGLVLVYTASSVQRGSGFPVLVKQAIAAVVGLAMALGCAFSDYRALRNRKLLIALSLVAIAASALVFCWQSVNGSRRWISILGISLQPSEFSRIVMLIVVSAWYAKIGLRAREFCRGVLVPVLILGAFLAPVAASPDIGATMVMCIGSGAILLAAGVRKRWMLIGFLTIVALVVVMLASNKNKRDRVMVYVNRMFLHKKTKSATAYHVEQSLEAFARGGMRGRGIGGSIQKYRYLPEANSDFIFAIAAEEFGIAGTVSMVLAYLVILISGIYIAYHAIDRFGSFLALGLVVTITFEAAFNIGMVTGWLPTKGIALPFASAGGTSLMASMIIIGLLFSIGSVAIKEPSTLKVRDAQIEY